MCMVGLPIPPGLPSLISEAYFQIEPCELLLLLSCSLYPDSDLIFILEYLLTRIFFL